MPLTTESKSRIFSLLKKVMEEHCPPLVIKRSTGDSIEVIGNIPAPYGYKKEIVTGMYFASALVRKDNVSFYFFCNYIDPQAYNAIAPTVMKCLDGKSCFHFKKEGQAVEKNCVQCLKKGLPRIRKRVG
jgi:hypothetical protein